jgi:hypothetical protein
VITRHADLSNRVTHFPREHRGQMASTDEIDKTFSPILATHSVCGRPRGATAGSVIGQARHYERV